jgi:hypothetical protein
MNNKFILGSVFAVFLLLPAALHGQAAQARIDAVLAEAARLQLPVSVLKNKVAEGRAKNVPAEKIAAVVEARLKTFVRASDVLTRMNITARGAGEVVLLADALDAGIRENIAVETLRSIPPERREVTMSALTSMVRGGVVTELQLADVQRASAGSLKISPEKLAEIIANWDALLEASRKKREDYKKMLEEILKDPRMQHVTVTANPLSPAVPPVAP